MKVKCSLVEEKFHRLSASEWALIIFLIRRADERTATAEGVYYRNVMKETGICKQSFYNALRGLEEKEIIKVVKESDLDYDVRICGNEYPVQTTEAYKEEPYINLNMDIFYTEAFKKLKPHEKYLLFMFLRYSHEKGHSYRHKADEFYKDIKEVLKVTKRVIRGYLCSLKQFFSIGIKNGIYYVTCKIDTIKKSKGRKMEEVWKYEQAVRTECHRNHTEYSDKDLYDTAYLVITSREKFGGCGTEIVLSMIRECIRKSVSGLLRRERRLSPAYINKLLTDKLNSLSTEQKEKSERIARNLSNTNKNRFHNFEQRKYDYDQLEALLLSTSPN